MKIFRWKAIVPMVLLLGLVAGLWTLYVDTAIRRALEFVGTEVVGAKVEVGSARLRLRHADLVLTGIQVTNPNAPMTNLIEVPEIRASLNGRALLMKKVVVESLAVQGVRFGTPRQTSGALENPSPEAGAVTRRVLDWAGSIPIPTLDLQGIVGTVVRIPAVDADSLRTPRQARAIVATGDSLEAALTAEIQGLDPRPTVDSGRALVTRIQAADFRRMTPVQLAQAANEVRTMIGRVSAMKTRLDSATMRATRGVGVLRAGVEGLDDARRADLAFVRGLVKLPSFDAPDVSMAMFGPLVTDRLKPVMYWAQVAERYVPPGLDPRRRTGPKRLRKSGTTFDFPLEHSWPKFLVERAVMDLAIGGRTVASGSYTAEASGVTTEPAVYGRPLSFRARRTSTVGPRDLNIGGTIDRTGRLALDSMQALVPRIAIPAFTIPNTNVRVDLGDTSVMQLALTRAGTELQGIWRVNSDAVSWSRAGDTAVAADAPLGSKAWAEGLIWRAVSRIPRVELEARITGPLNRPSLALSSNIGDAVAASIRGVLGAELQRAEAQIRAKVDSMVARQVAEARAKVGEIQAEVNQRLAGPKEQLDQIETQLKEALARATAVPGVRLPTLPGIPRPGRP